MSGGGTDTRAAEKLAAATAAATLVESGMRLGLGTGTTVAPFLDIVAKRARAEALDLVCVASSVATGERAKALGLLVEPLDAPVDLAVDGADEVEFGTLRLIKGHGGALLREKLVAESAYRFVVIADRGKLVGRLGELVRLPVEIVPFGAKRTEARIAALGLDPVLRRNGAGEPYLTDNGNHLLDCVLPAGRDAAALAATLRTIAGVVETGLFLSGCAAAIIGYPDGSTRRFEGDALAAAGLAADAATLRALGLERPARPPLIAVMGVAAAGKSTVGALLAAALGVPFRDGDELHPEANRAKMQAGRPLDDDDRMPWLHRIAAQFAAWEREGGGGVIATSLLTRRYRDLVRCGAQDLVIVYLEGTRELLAQRIAGRRGHFMPASLLDTQFATLEPPGADEAAIVVSIADPPLEIVRTAIGRLAEMT